MQHIFFFNVNRRCFRCKNYACFSFCVPLYAFISIFAGLLLRYAISLVGTGCTRNMTASLCAYYGHCTTDTFEQLDYIVVHRFTIKLVVS
jgi:hypothetical protein